MSLNEGQGAGDVLRRARLAVAWPRKLIYEAVASQSRGSFFVVSAVIFSLSVLVGLLWPLGGLSRLLVPALPAGEQVRLPSPPPITGAEQSYLRKNYIALAEGFPAADLRPMPRPPSPGMFAVSPRSEPRLRQVIKLIREAADARRAGRAVDSSALTAADGLLDRIEEVEGRDRAAVLYHRGLVGILRGDTPATSRKPLNRALAIIERDLKTTTDDESGKRASGVKAAVHYALGQIALGTQEPAAALKEFDLAIAESVAAGDWNDADNHLFVLDPRTAIVDYDTGAFWNDKLVAANRAGDGVTAGKIVTTLSVERGDHWVGRSRLAASLQAAAAFWGMPDQVLLIRPQWREDDDPQWRTASQAARFISGESPNSVPAEALQPWVTLRHWRYMLANQNLDNATFRGEFRLRRDNPYLDFLDGWRLAALDPMGRDLVAHGVAGSTSTAYAFILHNQDLFPSSVVAEAATRSIFFGLPRWAGWLTSGGFLLLALLAIWRLWAVRASYRLMFTPYYWADRQAREAKGRGAAAGPGR